MKAESKRALAGLFRELKLLPLYGAIVVLIVALPVIARGADSLGLPGGTIALASLFGVVAVLSAFALWTVIPSGRRGRRMARAAKELGLRYRSRFHLPVSLSYVPGLAGSGIYRTFAHLVAGRRNGRSLLVFDVGTAAESGWAPGEWVTCAATQIPLQTVSLAIEPRHRVMHDEGWLGRVGTESSEFDRRYRVTCSDAFFATTVLDARMMAWLLGVDRRYAFEFGGTWALVSAQLADPKELPLILGALEGFVGHIPRVAASLRPWPGPPLT